MGIVRFIGDKPWRWFEYGYTYDVDFEYRKDRWFVYNDKHSSSIHNSRWGYPVCDHKYLFEIILDDRNSLR
jgi:hypothetical protein